MSWKTGTAVRRSPVIAALSAGAVALLFGFSPAAQAASGTFAYYTTSWQTISDPANSVCYSFNGTATAVRNNTDTTAVVYSDSHCSTPVATVGPSVQTQLQSAGSARFGQ
ncbi:hypothetical protein [Streptomyces abikoensis]|uniref:hypothetical protein n=1 Tax=Streptomyces abikoensis TaxID=97398 RepID=UPI0016754992|nr:hypothetical protein [Streptomyces abikoensis]GGP78111.1 hypothetical protein GCM10010214_61980 [Streptomyces abikoensis]